MSISAPIIDPMMLPSPPFRLAPPMMAAVMTRSSMPLPTVTAAFAISDPLKEDAAPNVAALPTTQTSVASAPSASEPITPADAYQEGSYSLIWSRIGSTSGVGPGFDNTINPSYVDAGAGLREAPGHAQPDAAIAAGDHDAAAAQVERCVHVVS